MDSEKEIKKKEKNKQKKSWIRRLMRWAAVVLAIIVLLPCVLYVPFVQNYVKNIVAEKVSESTGYGIELDRLLLKFPLRVSVDGLSVVEATGDTLASGRHVVVDVRMLPLFMGDVVIRKLEMSGVGYRMLSSDSSLLLVAKVEALKLDRSKVELLSERIDLSELLIDGADVEMKMDVRKSKQTPDTASAPANWLIGLERLSLRNVRYRMSMLPTIDSLDAVISEGSIEKVAVNLPVAMARVGCLKIDSLDVAYFTPEESTVKNFMEGYHPTDSVAADSLPSEPWTIIADKFRLNHSKAVYAQKDVQPSDGLDMQYIELGDINIAVDDFYNKGARMKVPLKGLSAVERSGLMVNSVSGVFEMDEKKMVADSLVVKTLLSEVMLDATIDNDFFSGENADSQADAVMSGSISLEEVGKVVPEIRPMLRSMTRVDNLSSEVKVHGKGNSVEIEKADVELPHIFSMAVSGGAKNFYDTEKMTCDLDMMGSLVGGNRVRPLLGLDKSMRVPVVKIRGNAGFAHSRLQASLKANVDGGRLVADGRLNMNNDGYKANLSLKNMDLRSVMPLGSLGKIDGDVFVDGQGYDIYKMRLEAQADIKAVEYDKMAYHNIAADVRLNKGDYEMMVVSQDDLAALDMAMSGHLSPDVYSAKLDGAIYNIDLKSMNMSSERLDGGLYIEGDVGVDLKKNLFAGRIRLSDIDMNYGTDAFRTDSIDMGFFSNQSRTFFRLRNQDALLTLKSSHGVKEWSDSLSPITSVLDSAMRLQRVDIGRFKQCLPTFELALKAGQDNIISEYLSSSGIVVGDLSAKVAKEDELLMNVDVQGMEVGGVVTDTLRFAAYSNSDSLLYDLHVGNEDVNADLFKVANLTGNVHDNSFALNLSQSDRDGRVGFDFGADFSIADSVVEMRLTPTNPVIAFRDWTINEDNFVAYDLGRNSVKAGLEINSGNNIYIKMYSDDPPVNNGMNVDIAGIELKDWLTLSPFSPPIDGTLSSKMKIYYNGEYVWGNGKIRVGDLSYGKNRVGDIDLNSKVAYVGESKMIYADMGMDIDGREVVTLKGRSDSVSNSQYKLRLQMKRFPLSAANAFLSGDVGRASGFLNADMQVEGDLQKPDITGYVQFDSTEVVMPTFGTRFNMDTARIAISDGSVRFADYKMYGVNRSPLSIDGSFKFMPFDKMFANLKMSGRNVQIVDGKKSGKAAVYGKGFADIDVDVKGYMNQLEMFANLAVLSGTNLTYVMQDAVSEVTESSGDDVVKFVQFNDTTVRKQLADTVEVKPFSMKINALLSVQPNAVFTINLSPDGKNKVQIDGDATLNYSQTDQGDMRMTGKYVINSGFVRYSPPMLGEKLFYFTDGSSVVWTGDVLNPQLNVKAVETVKANVTTDGNSRLVPFEVVLNVENTLQQLDVSFDLSTDADLSIANELNGMTKEQRATQAMNMLLYGSYTGGATTTNSSFSGENMAYSFLESTLNKWASNNVRGVDLSFGIDQYDKTVNGTTSSTMSYSYQVSKSVFDDRFKISVGGNYSTDSSAEDNLSQNLFNDISFEYRLNKGGTAYVKLFHHSEFESILEGEITETGGGFVWRRKISSWQEMFRFLKKMKRKKKEDATTRQKIVVDSVEKSIEK